MFARRMPLFGALGGVAALVALAGCAPAAEPTPSTSPPSATQTPEPTYDGPLVFVGDELAALLPTAAEISSLLPGSGTLGEVTNVLDLVSDGGGPEYDPAVCVNLYREQAGGGVGARVMEWESGIDGWSSSAIAIQFATEDTARERFAEMQSVADLCESITGGGPESFTDIAVAEGADSQALVGVHESAPSEQQWKAVRGYAVSGNTLVAVTHYFQDDTDFDTQGLAHILTATGDEAATGQREILARESDAPTDAPSVNAEGSWAEWEIGDSFIGPVSVGMTAEEILSAVPGAQITEAEYRPSRLTSADGASHVWVTFDEQDSATQVAIGALRSIEPAEDGDALPALDGLRLGSPVSAIEAALPGGTFMHAESSGDSLYVVADREGRVFEIVLATGDRDPNAAVRGIRVADGTSSSATVYE